MENRVHVSQKGLSKFRLKNRESFQFVVGEVVYFCNPFCAELISNLVFQFRTLDPFFSSYTVKTIDKNGSFNKIIDFMYGEELILEQSDLLFFYSIGNELQIQEIVELSVFKMEELTHENIYIRVSEKISIDAPLDQEIEFIASNFSSFSQNLFIYFPIGFIESIISSKDLVIPNEGTLFRFILNAIEHYGVDSTYLLGYVNCDYLNPNEMEEYFEKSMKQPLSSGVLESLRRRLLCHVIALDRQSGHRLSNMTFSFENDYFNGVFRYLSQVYGGNVYSTGAVGFQSSGTKWGTISNIVSDDDDSYWGTTHRKNSWLRFDFALSPLLLSGYSIKTNGSNFNVYQPKSWKLEASNDLFQWVLVDNIENFTKFRQANNVSHYFPAATNVYYRYYTITMTDNNWNNRESLAICQIEFFGSLKQNQK